MSSTPKLWWRRVLAFLIDLVIIIMLSVLPLTAMSSFLAPGLVAEIILFLLFVSIGYGVYNPFLLCRGDARHGQTVGKNWMKIRIISLDGGRVTFKQALLREFVGKGISSLYLFRIELALVAVVNYLWLIPDKDNLVLHDRVAKTRVVSA